TAKFADGLSNTVLAGEEAYDVTQQGDSWYWDESVFLGGSKGTSRGAVGLVRDAPVIPVRENWGSPHPGCVRFLLGDGGGRALRLRPGPDGRGRGEGRATPAAGQRRGRRADGAVLVLRAGRRLRGVGGLRADHPAAAAQRLRRDLRPRRRRRGPDDVVARPR